MWATRCSGRTRTSSKRGLAAPSDKWTSTHRERLLRRAGLRQLLLAAVRRRLHQVLGQDPGRVAKRGRRRRRAHEPGRNKTSSSFERPSVALDLSVPQGVKSVKVYHLNSPEGAGTVADSITYGGSQWTYGSLGKKVKIVRKNTEQITVKNGVSQVKVQSSEAVLVWL